MGSLVGWPGVGGTSSDVEPIGLGARIVMWRDHDLRRAGLRVPAHELAQKLRPLTSAKHRTNCSTVTACPSCRARKVHALAEDVGAEQGLDHAHDLAALVVDRGREKVVDLVIELRSDRMGQRTVFDQLLRAQDPHVADALDRARTLIGRKLLWRKIVRPSFRQSWNQSRQVTRSPVQLWKYS